MRLNTDYYQRILSEKQISDVEIIKATGLSKKSYKWILENGSIEYETLERIADAIGCEVGNILKSDYEGYTENVIEWIRDEKRAALSLSQRRTIFRVKQLAESRPEECQIVAENKDGSICAHVPVDWIRINPVRELTEERRKQRAEILRKNMLKHQLQ